MSVENLTKVLLETWKKLKTEETRILGDINAIHPFIKDHSATPDDRRFYAELSRSLREIRKEKERIIKIAIDYNLVPEERKNNPGSLFDSII